MTDRAGEAREEEQSTVILCDRTAAHAYGVLRRRYHHQIAAAAAMIAASPADVHAAIGTLEGDELPPCKCGESLVRVPVGELPVAGAVGDPDACAVPPGFDVVPGEDLAVGVGEGESGGCGEPTAEADSPPGGWRFGGVGYRVGGGMLIVRANRVRAVTGCPLVLACVATTGTSPGRADPGT